MRKLKSFQSHVFTLLFVGTIIAFHSCVNGDYDLDNIDKNVVFSQNGLVLPIGSLSPIYLIEQEVDEGDATFYYSIDDFFSKDFYEMFVMDEEKENRPIGGISFSAGIEYNLEDVDALGALQVKTEILDASGRNVGIFFPYQSYSLQNNKGEYNFKIPKEDMLRLKNAYSLKYTFYVEAEEFNLTASDVIKIKNMQFVSEGGIHTKL